MTDVLGQPCGYTVIPHSWLSWFIKLSTFLWTYIAMEKSFVFDYVQYLSIYNGD